MNPQLHNVFVYGSLLADDVLQVLLRRLPDSSTAILPDFHRFSIKRRVYPAIVPVLGKEVSGKILFGITDKELHILDHFEDDEYDRRTVTVTLTETVTKKVEAYTYVWGNKHDSNLYGDWNFEEWTIDHMDEFVKMSAAFMEELELNESKTRVAIYDTLNQERDDS